MDSKGKIDLSADPTKENTMSSTKVSQPSCATPVNEGSNCGCVNVGDAKLGAYVREQAEKHGWVKGDPEDAMTYMMRLCREVAIEDCKNIAGNAQKELHRKEIERERADHAMAIAMLKAGHARDTVQLVNTCDKYDEMESCLREATEALETCNSDANAVGADGGQSFDEDKVEAALKRCNQLI